VATSRASGWASAIVFILGKGGPPPLPTTEGKGTVKTLVQASLLSAVGLVLLSGDVQAGAVTASALLCRPLTNPSGFVYGTNGIANVSSNVELVTCIIPMDNQVLGSTVAFQMRVFDNSSTQGFSCAPTIINEVGNGTGGTDAGARTTTEAFTGTSTLGVFGNWTATVSGSNVNTNVYAIQCSMPGNFSVIYSARAQ
jgi:hypothetical protein